jgi:hypothetical protein
MAGAVQRPAFPTKGRASNIRTLVAALGLGNSLLTNYYGRHGDQLDPVVARLLHDLGALRADHLPANG